MPEVENRKPDRIPGQRWGLALATALALVLPGAASAQNVLTADNADIYELKDKALVERLWRALYPDSALPQGEFQVLIPYSANPENQKTAYLLRDGTEAGALSMEDWRRLSAESPRSSWWKRGLRSGDAKERPFLWRALGADWRTWVKRGEWPAGLLFGIGSAISGVPHSSPQFERRIDFEWNQKLLGHFLLGASLHRTQFGGGLTHAWENRQAPADPFPSDPDYWTDPYWWWSVSWGLPGVRYTASLANQPLPRYFWLETEADSLIENLETGKVVRQWTDDESLALAGNVAHTLDFRLAYFRYGVHFDGDAYSAAVHSFMIEDVPAFFGSWGAGVMAAGGVAATRVWVDIPDLAFTFPAPQAWPSDFRVAFLRLDFAYRNFRSYHLGLAVTVRLDNRLLNLPGA